MKGRLLTEDRSEIELVPAAQRDVWFKRAGVSTHTYEDYLRDKATREGVFECVVDESAGLADG